MNPCRTSWLCLLLYFMGDNGAPLKLTMSDDPVRLDGAYWDGSKNTPLNGEKGMLFDLAKDIGEKQDFAEKNPDLVRELEAGLTHWTADLIPAGIPTGTGNDQEQKFYQHYFPTVQS